MNPRLLAAQYRLGQLRGEELPDIAIALLQSGHDAQPLWVLAGFDRPTLRDVGSLFEEALATIGQEIPSEHGARRVLLERVLEQIVRGEVDPGDGAYEVWFAANDLFGEHLDEWAPFVGLASDYEGYPADRDQVRREIVDRAAGALETLRAAVA